MKISAHIFLFVFLLLCSQTILAAATDSTEHVYVYKGGEVVADMVADSIDSVAIVSKRQIKFLDINKKILLNKMFSTQVDSIIVKIPEPEPEPDITTYSLHNKSVAFVGNSHIYYGGTTAKGTPNQPDSGIFYKLCTNHGWNTTVYDLTWGGKIIRDIIDLITLSESVRSNIEFVFFNQPVPLDDGTTQAEFNTYCLEMAKMFPNAKFYYLLTYYNEASSAKKTQCETMVNYLRTNGIDVSMLRWGQLCTDLIAQRVSVENSKFSGGYVASTFKISDQSHPTPLAGYIQAQIAFTKATNISAVGEDYTVCENAQYGNGCKGYSGYITNYFSGNAGATNFDDIMATPTEMNGLQKLIDNYSTK